MFVYYGYLLPMSLTHRPRLLRGRHLGGLGVHPVQRDRRASAGAKASIEVSLIVISRLRNLARRLDVPGDNYGAARRLLRDKIGEHAIHFSAPASISARTTSATRPSGRESLAWVTEPSVATDRASGPRTNADRPGPTGAGNMAARATWKGYLKISLVNIPIKVFPATESSGSISFNQLHAECQTRIQQKKWCPHCEREVPNTEIVKGYEFEKGRYVVMSRRGLREGPHRVDARHRPGAVCRRVGDRSDVRRPHLLPGARRRHRRPTRSR